MANLLDLFISTAYGRFWAVRLNYRAYYTDKTGMSEILCIKGISAKVYTRAPETGRYVFLS